MEVAPLTKVTKKGEEGWGLSTPTPPVLVPQSQPRAWMALPATGPSSHSQENRQVVWPNERAGVHREGPEGPLGGAEVGLARPMGEGTEGPAAGPTLAGTLETCVLGGRGGPLAQSRRGWRGPRSQTPCPPTQSTGPGRPKPPPRPGAQRQEPACLSQQGSQLGAGDWA